jgi:hypothetical protein
MNGIAAGSATSGHTVLAEAEGGAYQSLRQRPVTRAERYALGKSLRKRVPRRSLADWTPPSDRPDPIQQIMVSHQGRADRLIPVRVGRMIASPYGFLRGTAVVMAEDVARLPSTGITPVVCGDSHLGNFGFYASPERDLVIDLNDFDEAHPGGWEWDLRRLVASIWVAGRQNGASEEQCGASARSCVGSYRQELRRLADQPLFSRSFVRLDVDRLAAETAGPLQAGVARSAKRARNRTSDRALPRFTREVDGVRKIVEEPPLITRPPEREAGRTRGENDARTSDRRSRQVDRPTWRATGVHPSSLFRYRPNRPIPIKTRCQNTTELMKTVVGQRKIAGDSTADHNASPRGVAIDNPGGEAADVAHAGRAERRA